MHQFKDLVKVGFVSITQVPGPPEGRSKKNNSQKWSWEGYQQIGGVGKMQALVPLQKHQKKKKSWNCQNQLCQNSRNQSEAYSNQVNADSRKKQLKNGKFCGLSICFYTTPSPGKAVLEREQLGYLCGILFLGSRRSRAELVHTLSCMPVLICLGVTWRCLSQFCLTQTSGQKSSGHSLKMLIGELTTYGCLGQKIMAQIYNRLPKSQEEKLGKILQEIGTFPKHLSIQANLESHAQSQGKILAQKRPEKVLSSHLVPVPRLSISLI